MNNRAGTVGRLLPLIEHQLEQVDGIDVGGRLLVRGPNVMAGYLRDGAIEGPAEGWYDTGDIVTVDAEGYVTIVGRVKRFAKLGGEMVSLAAAEGIAETAVPATRHAVVSLPDPRRGEKLVLVTEAHDFDRNRLLEAAHRLGMPEIAVPREVIEIDQMPLLGTGKTDYPAVARLAERAMAVPPREIAAAEPALVRG
jgi:acyl-[acyl-carrier-protein]-phospholipid O-acyltransferase/long-chain-fatty-acid--[acyl-carrier-protein] ligase